MESIAKSGRLAASLLISTGLTCCSELQAGPRTQLYPNDYYRRVGPEQAEADRMRCRQLAEEYQERPEWYNNEIVRSGAVGVGVGAGTGALAGVITKGKVGRTTAAGAAVGGVLGVLKGIYDQRQDPSYERFVAHCLEQQGYEVIRPG